MVIHIFFVNPLCLSQYTYHSWFIFKLIIVLAALFLHASHFQDYFSVTPSTLSISIKLSSINTHSHIKVFELSTPLAVFLLSRQILPQCSNSVCFCAQNEMRGQSAQQKDNPIAKIMHDVSLTVVTPMSMGWALAQAAEKGFGSPSLKIFKNCLDVVLGNLLWVPLLHQRG